MTGVAYLRKLDENKSVGNPRPKPKHLAAKLLALRHKLGVGQLKLSRELGVDAYRISEFESGRREPNLMVLLRYARLANVSVESLIDDELELRSFSDEKRNRANV